MNLINSVWHSRTFAHYWTIAQKSLLVVWRISSTRAILVQFEIWRHKWLLCIRLRIKSCLMLISIGICSCQAWSSIFLVSNTCCVDQEAMYFEFGLVFAHVVQVQIGFILCRAYVIRLSLKRALILQRCHCLTLDISIMIRMIANDRAFGLSWPFPIEQVVKHQIQFSAACFAAYDVKEEI